jgi:hypothetical protein
MKLDHGASQRWVARREADFMRRFRDRATLHLHPSHLPRCWHGGAPQCWWMLRTRCW